ncbi:nucleoid-associated protein EbfC [Marmoricola sp. URHA0025 HA25]
MTDDPSPMGGFDLGAMLEQAQQMQAQLVSAQAELAAQTVEGRAGGVTAVVSGTGELVGVRLPTGTFDANDEESLADLGDLVVAAFRDAKAKADGLAAQALGPLAGGLGGDLGGGFGGLTGGSPGV